MRRLGTNTDPHGLPRHPSGRSHARTLLPVAVAFVLGTGCAVGPDYTRPVLEPPDRWNLELTDGLAAGDANLHTWWEIFNDPLLDDLVRRAREGNLDLEEAFARIQESRARRGIARGDFFPDVDGAGTYRRQRTSEDFGIANVDQNRTFDLYSAGLDMSWEIDLFGRVRRSVESADASIEASIEDYRDILVTLLSDVGGSYVEVRTLQRRLALAEQNVLIQRDTLQLTEDRNRAGLVGDLDVAQAQRNLAVTEAFLPQLRAAVVQRINRLGVLLGETPGALHAELRAPGAVPEAPDQVVVGLPFDLLRQRPDLRRAERDLAAQTARIGIATADLYPRFSILGTFAFDATDAADLFTGDMRGFSIGPAVRWNLFEGGRIRSRIAVEDARTEQALIRYEKSLLFALQEVEDSMVAYAEQRVRSEALARSVEAAVTATELVQKLYRAGLTDFQNVLDTERSLFEQQDALAESEGLVALTLIRVYQALGGGWSP